MARSSRARPEAELTIDRLAQVTGMTARNIRAHQSRGLIPPPQVRGRTGYYGPEHVARLKLILDMQVDGYNLRTITRLLKTMAPGTADDVLDFGRVLRTAWQEETSEIVGAAELAARIGVEPGGDVVGERARRLELLTPLPDGRVEVRSPALIRAGETLARIGVPGRSLIAVQEELLKHAERVAKTFVKLFLDEVWRPFVKDGQPESEWPRVRAALDAMIPVAHDALAASFRLAMSHEVEAAFGKVLHEQAQRAR